MDKDFFQTHECDRCKVPMQISIMSKMNTDALCMDCKEEEKGHPLYELACKTEHEAVKAGNYNYEGLFAGKTYPFPDSEGDSKPKLNEMTSPMKVNFLQMLNASGECNNDSLAKKCYSNSKFVDFAIHQLASLDLVKFTNGGFFEISEKGKLYLTTIDK